MLCPSCKTPLSMTDRSGIEIDFCPTCRGVWLDRGELDKMIERSAAAAPPPANSSGYQQPMAPPDYRSGPYGHGHYGHRPRKKKSFLSEVFDFD